MKLVQRIQLGLVEGTSDKVYIVELCEVGSGRFVVNFQFGRRGKPLQSGTKTESPVNLRQAQSIYERLVDEKKRKGYSEARGAAGAAPTPAAAAPSTPRFADRDAALLDRLRRRQSSSDKWALSRAIWRVGELRFRPALPRLVELVDGGNAMLDYALAFALGRCGDTSTVEALARRHGEPVYIVRCPGCRSDNRIPYARQRESARCGGCKAPLPNDGPLHAAATSLSILFPKAVKEPQVARAALEAIRAWGGECRAGVEAQALAALPTELRELALTGPPTAFAGALARHLTADTADAYAVLEDIYRLDSPTVRAGLIDALRAAPLRPPAFRAVRHIFKSAEMRRDPEVYGLLAHRFETVVAMFKKPRYGDRVYLGRQVLRSKAELQKPDTRLAYSSRTRDYLRRRAWRILGRLGHDGDLDYVKMAVGVLLPFRDQDGGQPRTYTRWDYSARKNVSTHWDTFSAFRAFNHILYGNSPRYELTPGRVSWRCRGAYKPGDPALPVREESFPQLWDRLPVGLLHLVAESACGRVHEFAIKALRANPDFCAALELEVLVMILGRPYEVSAAFGFELARARYRPESPDLALLGALVDCAHGPARAQAWKWIDAARIYVLASDDLLARAILAGYLDSRVQARRLVEGAGIPEYVAERVVARVVAGLMAMSESPGNDATARAASDTLLLAFAPQMRRLGLHVVGNLLAHPMAAVQELGARILVVHEIPAERQPQELTAAALRSPFPAVRSLGVRLFGALPDDALLRREALIVDLVLSPQAEMREGVRPVIRRLAQRSPEFGRELSRLLIARLLAPEAYEGLHAHVLGVLRGELLPALRAVPKDVVLRLLRGRSPQAQELGGHLLADNVDPQELEVAEVARLSSHEILSVRQAAWKFYEKSLPRIRAELGEAIRIVDAKWEDSRNFAFQLFRDHFTDDEFTPDVLVGLCDSVRPDVQRFGQEMITRFFHEAQGPDYLLRLSEHPSADLQLFASNFLERYAAGSDERLFRLRPYFLGVLSRVNRGRVAKARVLAFLEREALARREAAVFVADLLIRQSLTIAVGDRAACIAALLAIHRAYPDLPVPLAVNAAPLRSRPPEVQGGV